MDTETATHRPTGYSLQVPFLKSIRLIKLNSSAAECQVPGHRDETRRETKIEMSVVQPNKRVCQDGGLQPNTEKEATFCVPHSVQNHERK